MLDIVLKRLLSLVTLILLVAFSHGSIEPAKRDYFTVDRDELLQAMSELSLPSAVTKPDRPFLYLHVGPVRCDVFALSMGNLSPQEFAAIVDTALKDGFGREFVVKYSLERGLAVVDSDINDSALFKTSARRTVDIDKIRKTFQAQGLNPQIVVRTLKLAKTEGISAEAKGRKRFNYYDATSASQITTSESLAWFTWPLLVSFTLLLPISFKIGLVLGLKGANNASVDIEARRSRYKNFVYGSMILGIGAHLATFVTLYGSNQFSILSDLWTGTTSMSSIGGLLLMAGVLLMGPMSKKVDKQEAQLMGTDLIEREKRRPYEAKVRRQVGMISFAIMIPGFVVFTYVVQVLRQPRPAIMIFLVCALAGVGLMGPIESYIRRKYPESPSSDNETSS